MFNPRPKQQEVLDYLFGRMGVAAVPGSGKTRTLSYLAAKLVATAPLEDGQEILIVTLVNSAVNHFAEQVRRFIQTEYQLLPNFGYRVRTLHSLANDIVRERPALVGLADDFAIADEREAADILQDAVDSYLRAHPFTAEEFLADDYVENRQVKGYDFPEAVRTIANNFIRQAKDWRLTPDQLRERVESLSVPLPLAEMCYQIYIDYQRGLAYRGAIDFQDLIRLALRALELDSEFLKRLQRRWPYILEDEAQDSSELQEKILRLLVGSDGNWVRVGDPNQAIYETFTTANPEFLRSFMREPGVQARELPNSGRSSQSIMTLANYLTEWAQRHPVLEIRDRNPLSPPYIEPAPPGDPQPNPLDEPTQLHLRAENYSPDREIDVVVKSLANWLPQHPELTAAVLVPRNKRGFELVDALKAAKIEYVELLRSSTSTREAAGALGNILNYLANPTSENQLAIAYRVWQRDSREDAAAAKVVDDVAKLLRGCRKVEDFVAPRAVDWLDTVEPVINSADLRDHLLIFRALIQRWQQAAVLPIDQLVLTIAQDLFRTEIDLAIAYSIALYLRRTGDSRPDWRIPDFTEELGRVARNERRFLGMSDDDLGFNPDQHKGKVTVATMHSAKGLEWDRVYLMSVNSYDFPSAQPFDRYMSEKWFVRDALNLEAEALEQLKSLVNNTPYTEGIATRAARVDYATERLRLLYVGITRARRQLVITWNVGRDAKQQEALPLIALRTFWEQYQPEGQ